MLQNIKGDDKQNVITSLSSLDFLQYQQIHIFLLVNIRLFPLFGVYILNARFVNALFFFVPYLFHTFLRIIVHL